MAIAFYDDLPDDEGEMVTQLLEISVKTCTLIYSVRTIFL